MVIFNIYCFQRLTSYCFCVLHVDSWCFTFVRNFIIISHTVFNLQSGHEYMVEMAMFNVQRAITPKVTVHVFCTSSHSVLNLCEVS